MKNIILLLLIYTPVIYAGALHDLWLSPEQRGVAALAAQQPTKALKLLHNPLWQGVAQFRSGQYQQAEQSFAKEHSALAHFNRGNALAYQEKYQAAIDAYQQALTLAPDFTDAQYNRDLLKKYLQQQQQKNQERNKQQHKQEQEQQQEKQKEKEQNKKQKAEQQKSAKQATQNDSSHQQQASNPSDKAKPAQTPKASENEDSSEPTSNQPPLSNTPAINEHKTNHHQTDKEYSKLTNNTSNQTHDTQALQNTTDTAQQEQEQKQAQQQWLRRIPDNPPGLLRQKFLRDYQRKRGGQSS